MQPLRRIYRIHTEAPPETATLLNTSERSGYWQVSRTPPSRLIKHTGARKPSSGTRRLLEESSGAWFSGGLRHSQRAGTQLKMNIAAEDLQLQELMKMLKKSGILCVLIDD